MLCSELEAYPKISIVTAGETSTVISLETMFSESPIIGGNVKFFITKSSIRIDSAFIFMQYIFESVFTCLEYPISSGSSYSFFVRLNPIC